jgi:hypothetical protein
VGREEGAERRFKAAISYITATAHENVHTAH